MNEVCAEFDLRRETYYLAYHFLNLYLDKSYNILKKNLQLIGTTALFLACKIEEIFTPRIELFIIATDDAYVKSEILETERKIITELEWNLLPQTLENWVNAWMHKWDSYLFKNLHILKDIGIFTNANWEISEKDIVGYLEKYWALDISLNFDSK